MFGYIRVDRANLLGKEYDAYKGIYCALCKQLGRDYSIFARFILSYDCTFYAMLALDMADTPPCYENGRCRFNPFKQCLYAESETEALSLAAALSVVSAYYKLLDNLADSPWYKRIAYRLVQPFFSHWRKKAAKRYPQIDFSLKKMLDEQMNAERDPGCLPDMAAQPTANMLSEMCSLLFDQIPLRDGLDKEKSRRILSSVGYFMGRWIYFIDAADDYDKDRKNGGFNPFLLNTSSNEIPTEHMRATLNHALSEALLSYGLYDSGRFDGIITNVLRVSCVNIQNKIISEYNNDKAPSEV